MDFLNSVWLGNDVATWVQAIAVGLGTMIVLRVTVPFLIRRSRVLARSTSSYFDDSLVAAASATKSFFYAVVGMYAVTVMLDVPERFDWLLGQILACAVLIQVGLWIGTGYRTALEHYRNDRYADDADVLTSFTLFRAGGAIILWFFVVVFTLQVWGVNVTALVTSLGIGGIAVALAVQSILKDLFASLSIIFDKPFLVGDFVAVGDYKGTVESIGLKTTQVRSFTGEQLVFSNSDLLASRIRNYGRMEERRGEFRFGIVYESDPDAVQAIPDLVRSLVESEEQTRFDRSRRDGGGFERGTRASEGG
jgi:small-conductance mechanosensitive channel